MGDQSRSLSTKRQTDKRLRLLNGDQKMEALNIEITCNTRESSTE